MIIKIWFSKGSKLVLLKLGYNTGVVFLQVLYFILSEVSEILLYLI